MRNITNYSIEILMNIIILGKITIQEEINKSNVFELISRLHNDESYSSSQALMHSYFTDSSNV